MTAEFLRHEPCSDHFNTLLEIFQHLKLLGLDFHTFISNCYISEELINTFMTRPK